MEGGFEVSTFHKRFLILVIPQRCLKNGSEGKLNTMETGDGMDAWMRYNRRSQRKYQNFKRENRTQTENELTGSSRPLWLWVGRFRQKKRNLFEVFRGNE
jgi:hypothetical protein